MSTRSIIGTVARNGDFEGLYCHYDGYPSNMVPALAAIITRDGAAALDVLTGKTAVAPGGPAGYWNSICPQMPAHDMPLLYPTTGEYWDAVPAGQRNPGIESLIAHLGCDRDKAEFRSEIAEGYGIMHSKATKFVGNIHKAPNTGWTEWMYLFTEDLTLLALDVLRGSVVEAGRFTVADLKALAEGDVTVQARVGVAECGEGFSKCIHYAWFHDDSVPSEARGLSMRSWMGKAPVPLSQAVAVIVDGERLELDAGGYSGRGKWWRTVRGTGVGVAVFRVGRDGRDDELLPGVELVLPPTRAVVGV